MLNSSYILYHKPRGTGSIGCDHALDIIQKNYFLKRNVESVNVYDIEKPPWMVGVPVLAKIATKEIWIGTPAIEQLKYLSVMNNSDSYVNQPWQNYQTNFN